MAIKIRRMRPSDYDALVSTWKAAGLPYRPKGRDSRRNIERELKLDTSLFFVAEEKRKIVGVVLGTQDGRKVWPNRIGGVHPRLTPNQRMGSHRLFICLLLVQAPRGRRGRFPA